MKNHTLILLFFFLILISGCTKTAEEASDLWQEIYKRKLSSKEKKALTEGYNSNTK